MSSEAIGSASGAPVVATNTPAMTTLETVRKQRNEREQKRKMRRHQLLAFANAEIFLIDSPRRSGISRFLTTVFLKDINYARETVAKYPPSYGMLLDWLKEAEKDGKIKTGNLLLAAKVFYALVEGAITYPGLFSGGINKSAVNPMLDEIIATFLARYSNEK